MPRYLIALILGLTSCRDGARVNREPVSDAPDFHAELLVAIADSAHCLHALGEVPDPDFLEAVIRDCLILNQLKASNPVPTEIEAAHFQYVEWKGRNPVLLLRAAQPLLLELLDSLTDLSHQLRRVAHASTEPTPTIEAVREKVEELRKAVDLGVQVARDPENIVSKDLYHPEIKTNLQEAVGTLLALQTSIQTRRP